MPKGIGDFAKGLRIRTPQSELWFMEIAERNGFKFWKRSRMKGWDDKFNRALYGIFIPDIHNLRLKFIIEIDGSFHNIPDQKIKDARKDTHYQKWGFTTFRVAAYNEALAMGTLRKIEQLRADKWDGIPKKIKLKIKSTGYDPTDNEEFWGSKYGLKNV